VSPIDAARFNGRLGFHFMNPVNPSNPVTRFTRIYKIYKISVKT
jgi:hypothetical protein